MMRRRAAVITADGGYRRGKVIELKKNVDVALAEDADDSKVFCGEAHEERGADEGGAGYLVSRGDGGGVCGMRGGGAGLRAVVFYFVYVRDDRQAEGGGAYDGGVFARGVSDEQVCF